MTSDAIKIGLISDTHAQSLQRIFKYIAPRFEGCHRIFHLGDHTNYRVIEDLELYAPVTSVRGNNDGWEFERIPTFKTERIRGVRFGLVHGVGFGHHVSSWCIENYPDEVDILLHGHSHIADVRNIDGIWVINPGSTQASRDGRECSFAVLTADENSAQVEHIFFPSETVETSPLPGIRVRGE